MSLQIFLLVTVNNFAAKIIFAFPCDGDATVTRIARTTPMRKIAPNLNVRRMNSVVPEQKLNASRRPNYVMGITIVQTAQMKETLVVSIITASLYFIFSSIFHLFSQRKLCARHSVVNLAVKSLWKAAFVHAARA